MRMETKYSLFNNLIPINGRHTVIYNSFTGKTVVIKNKNPQNYNDLRRLCDISPSLYEQLIESGIFIKSTRDEIKELEERVLEGMDNSEENILHINPTLECNFNCWYCYENHIKSSRMSSEVMEGLYNFIKRSLDDKRIKTFHLGFFGGEPLLYFNDVTKKIIVDASDVCRARNVSLRVHFTTNGYCISNDILNFLSNFNCGFQITLDGGQKDHDKTRFLQGGIGSYATIITNIHKLAQNGHRVIVRVNYTSKNIKSVSSIFNEFSNLDEAEKDNLSFDFQRVWQDRESMEDNTEKIIFGIRNTFIDANLPVLSNYIPQDVRFPCYGDKKNHILINYNGDVFGCTARDFTKKNRIGVLNRNGLIDYDESIIALRKVSKFSKQICKTCRIAPICGGGCIQKAYELREQESCTLGYTDKDKDNIIINILDRAISLNRLKPNIL